VDNKYVNNDFIIESGGDNVVIGMDGCVRYIRKYSSKSLTNITRNIARLIIRMVLKIDKTYLNMHYNVYLIEIIEINTFKIS
jgi:hypothetical protein